MAWDDNLVGVHRAIAASDSQRIGVLAGPGTGKTRFGLMRRVVRLLEEGVPPERILLISFTRVAAADLRDKVAELDAPEAERVRATTLHGFCFGVLQQESVLAVTGRTPRILLRHESDLMLRDVGGDYGDIYARRRMLEAFEAGWARRQEDYPGVPGTSAERAFQAAALLWLRRHKAMLIGEVVPEAHRFLTGNPLADPLTAFDHVIVDEYQDLNALEQDLLDVLCANGALCVAGDDDQSIYSVRHANPEGIAAFMARDEVEDYSINVCGRCPSSILGCANHLIACAPDRFKPKLVPREECALGDVSIVQWPHTDDEIAGITSAIVEEVSSGRRRPGDILVLTNWRKAGMGVRDGLLQAHISVKAYFTEDIVKTDAAREAVALLRLVVDEGDAPSIRVVVGLGDSMGRSTAYRKVLAYCDEHAQSPQEVLSRLAAEEDLGLRVPALATRYSGAMSRTEYLRGLPLHDLVDELLPDGSDEHADLRSVALDALAGSSSAEELLAAVIEAVTQDDVPQNPDFVRVMSLHKSKGLTCDCVYIIASIDGVVPTVVSEDPVKVEAAQREGRRLFYVAVTRAAEELVISNAASMDFADANARRVRYDRSTIRVIQDRKVVRTIASPFIRELGPDAPRPVTGDEWLRSRRGQ